MITQDMGFWPYVYIKGTLMGRMLTSCHSQELGKVVYEGFHCWLARDHPYQKNQNPTHFNGKGLRNKPWPVITNDTLRLATKYETWLGIGNMHSWRGNSSKVNGIKHHITFYDYPILRYVLHFTNCACLDSIAFQFSMSRWTKIWLKMEMHE